MGSLVVILVVLAILGLRLRNEVLALTDETASARSELLSGAEILKAGGFGVTKSEASAAANDFSAAQQHFTHVHAVLTQSKVIGSVSFLPLAGTQVQAATQLSDIGTHVSRAGGIVVSILGNANAIGTVEAGPGEKALNILTALSPRLRDLQAEIDIASTDRARIPSSGLLPQISNAVKQFDGKFNLTSARSSLSALRANEPAIHSILGASGPRSYLVLQQDPAELRATGGFIGSVGFLNFDKGKMAPYAPTDIYSIDWNRFKQDVLGPAGSPSYVEPPAPLVQAFRVGSWELRDSNWSPDFPTSARQAELLLMKESGRKVDGVIALDPYFISGLLKVVGPTRIPETGDVVDASTFFATTLNRVELNQTADHKSFLSQAAKAIVPKVLALPASSWPSLLQVLGSGCSDHSLQAYFNDPAVQKLPAGFACDGAVMPPDGDGVLIVDSNLGGNKDDFWLKRKYTLRISLTPEGSARHELNLHFYDLTHQNVLLTQYLPYAGWLRVYLPASSSVISSAGANLTEANDLGRKVLEGWLHVDFNKTTDVDIVYDVGTIDMHQHNGHFDFYWQKQAGRPADPIHLILGLPHGWTPGGALVGSVPASATNIFSDLAVDRRFRFNYRS